MQSDNMRIAKNTVYLYLRMAATLFISLYTSRVVLDKLGVTDFGIYNVVGGVIALLGFITAPLTSTTQRYITFAIGKKDPTHLNNVVSDSLAIHLGLCIITLILVETVGLWFLNEKLVIPGDRFFAAAIVFQLSILTSIVTLMSAPFLGIIISYERMDFYAIVSIIGVVLKLGIAFLIGFGDIDGLILYAFLLFIVQLMTAFMCYYYCRKAFVEIKMSIRVHDRNLLKSMMGFAGWNFFGGMAYVINTQGVNILLNMYFGTVVNAARGLAVQVQGSVRNFAENVQNAINPQITKSYSTTDYNRVFELINMSTKYSLVLLFMVAAPIYVEAKAILNVWLVYTPEHTITFVRIMLLSVVIGVMSTPFIICSQATGDIKKIQIWTGVITLVVIPVSYVFLENGTTPELILIIVLVSEMLCHIVRILLLMRQISFPLKEYVLMLFRVIVTLALPTALLLLLYHSMNESWVRFISILSVSCLVTAGVTYYIILNNHERNIIVGFIKKQYEKVIKESSNGRLK